MENLHIPKYIDFFRNQEDYEDDYNIQFYFGNYFLFREKTEKALSFYERALSLSKTYTEKKQVLMKIQQCRELLNTTSLNLD